MAVKGFDKFLLLMWKNWLLQCRHPLQTAVEILAPVLFSALLVLIRSLVDPTNHPENTFFNEFEINSTLPISLSRETGPWNSGPPALIEKIFNLPPNFDFEDFDLRFGIVYSPKNNRIEKIMEHVRSAMDLNISIGINNSVQMNEILADSKIPNIATLALCGIQFDDSLSGDKELPPDLSITIRFPGESRFAKPSLIPSNWKTNFLFPLYQVAGPRQPEFADGGYPPGYHTERFLAVQHHLSYGIINYFREKSLDQVNDLPNITMQRYPYPPYIDDPLLMAMSNIISIIIMLSFVYTCISTVKVITAEKEKQLKEAMKIMGLPNWLHWLAWFLKSLSFMLISVIFIVILLKVQWVPGSGVSIFTNSDATVILFFLIIYMCTTISFCFMISVFFSKANIAATIAGLMWFLSYAPYLFLQQRYERLSLNEKLLACLGSNTAMAYGFQFMVMREGTGEGLQWWTIFKSITPDDSFVLGDIMIMLVVDAIIYLLIALYVEAVFPGEYGVPLPWYFPFTASYWCGLPRFIGVEDVKQNGSIPSKDIYEPEPSNLHVGVQIKHLRKEFRNKKVAVRDLCLNLYEGQITVLLGHNGAGKTTTMSMLTGMYPPTSGTAVIAGHDICADMPGVRASLGLCPQHNILFDDLTVEEHIYFFSKLKGLNKKEIGGEIEKYIRILELEPKAKALSKTLSGGMKRKLSVCVALCGNSKVVILDEPTAGMDPAARRALWDLLQEEKKNRTMLLSTHFMDEADLLGDRIAIMAGGTLQCCGSSFFLKKRYGTGYHLTMEKSMQCNAMKVTELLRKHIPNIQVQNNVGSELTYLLSEDQLPVFEKMLKELEENTGTLGILNYGISLTTMEEVFMKVGADSGQEEEQDALENNKDARLDTFNENILDMDLNRQSSESKLNIGDKLLTGSALWRNQFRAMMMKKIFSTLRSWLLMIIQIIIPVSFLIIAIIVVRSWKTYQDLPAIPITLGSYSNPRTIMNSSHNDTIVNAYESSYKDYFNKSQFLLEDLNGGNVEDYILQKATENLARFRLNYVVGASFLSNNRIRAWFNNEPYHSSPLALNLIHNAILKKVMGENYTNHKISIINHPQPYTMDTRLNRLSVGNNIGFQIAFNVGFSMAFVSSFYILFCVKERVSKAKHLQFVSGVNVLIFWISSYIWDMFTFIFTSVCFVTTLWLFQEDGFSTFTQIGRVFTVLLLFGHAMLSLIYLASFLFDIPSTGYVRMTLVNIFTGVAGFLVVEVLRNPALDLKDIADILDWIFLLIPHYSISSAMKNLHNSYSENQICNTYSNRFGPINRMHLCAVKNQCCDLNENYFSWKSPGIGRNLTFFSIVGVVLFLILIVIEYRIPEQIMYAIKGKNKSMAPPHDDQEDDDVAMERKNINSLSIMDINNYQLILQEFSKYYNKFLAVQRLTIGVKGNECFGLLGINGAGKTSTFKMLTGDEKISYGEAWVNGLSLKTKMKKVHEHIGYCPQFDALLDDLTGREIMTMFCLLRGIPSCDSKFIVEKLANDFRFTRHINKKVKEYSGGNKRKLSTAVALIGDPYVIYLDEPTTGMDPAAKRYLWNALCKVRDNGKCIVLTSHSMEECEALCTRIGIMVNGTFKCLGSTQHLKSKFSEGYTLTVKLKKENRINELIPYETDPVNKFIKDKFPSAILREHYQELLTYYISDTTLPWSRMFGIMEQGKRVLPVEDYSLGQASLEQVFLKFTKHQRSE